MDRLRERVTAQQADDNRRDRREDREPGRERAGSARLEQVHRLLGVTIEAPSSGWGSTTVDGDSSTSTAIRHMQAHRPGDAAPPGRREHRRNRTDVRRRRDELRNHAGCDRR